VDARIGNRVRRSIPVNQCERSRLGKGSRQKVSVSGTSPELREVLRHRKDRASRFDAVNDRIGSSQQNNGNLASWELKRARHLSAFNMPRIVIPDDAPPVMASSRAYRKLLERTRVDYHNNLPGREETLIERIAGAFARLESLSRIFSGEVNVYPPRYPTAVEPSSE
jgi:hypothetical protein